MLLEPQAVQDLKDRQGTLDHQDLMDNQVKQDLQDSKVLQGTQDPLEPMELRAFQDLQVNLDQLVLLVIEEVLVMLELLVT